MASSDDECEPVPQAVSNYHFVDDADEPISFSKLPVQWNEGEPLDGWKKQIFLHGTADGGLQKVHKQVIAWKFNLSGVTPEISVLSKENNWINLQKPRKSFIDIIRSSLITLQCLYIMRKTPEPSERTLWDELSKKFSLYERPSEDDLVDHKILISEAVKRDKILAKSKFLVTFLDEQPRKRKAFDEDIGTTAKSGFLDDSDMVDETEEDGSDEEGELFDSVCAICDNGGELLCCEGRCLRSFHATAEAGSDSLCESLGLSDEEVAAIQNFFCKNCESKQHQCFSCGELGSSDKSSGAEVLACVSATCGRFYHPRCVAKLVHRKSEALAEDFQRKIAAGESFTCPVHKCYVCKQGEDKMDPALQFAVCRRCPKAYHRKCLPRKIAFEDLEDEGIMQRAWEGLLPNRILIYCLEHEIDDEIATPTRNHIKFPNVGQTKKTKASAQLSRREKVVSKERSMVSEDAASKRTAVKPPKCIDKLSSAIKKGESSKTREQILSGPELSKKKKAKNTSPKPLNKTSSTKVNKSITHDSDNSWGERISALMRDAESSIKLEEIIKKHKMPLTHTYSSRNMADKGITLGKVERSIEAIRAALKKLEEGRCSREDAIAVCEPELVDQIFKWQTKFKMYLAPFIHGMRYTSFGRHFTQMEKLKEIVDLVHWYVQDGDMVVDFCCGANDFSCLMKKRLDEMGKKCSYKNYDIFQAKNDFNFEARDWMSVRPKELPAGSKLVMGLNPPFGFKAALANEFIDQALKFKPKLLILIVPQETERLDKKKKEPRYDLVWEDDELLSGKSFYLPGSVDVNDKPIDHSNVNPPPLYLWSHPDWTAKHRTIAQQHVHLSRSRSEPQMENVSHFPKDYKLKIGNFTMIDDNPAQNEEPEQLPERAPLMIETGKEGLACDNGETKGHNSNNNNRSYKRKCSGVKRRRGSGAALGSNGCGYRSYMNDMDEKYGNDGDSLSVVRHYGQPEPDSLSQRSSYLAGHDPQLSSPYNRMSASATQRYAPQLDELNHTRMASSLGSEVPYGGFYEPLARRPGFQADPLAFAPGPYRPFAQENSAGWLDE